MLITDFFLFKDLTKYSYNFSGTRDQGLPGQHKFSNWGPGTLVEARKGMLMENLSNFYQKLGNTLFGNTQYACSALISKG